MNENITVSAPGRICLFGEHQDYLGLPVIAAAVDMRVTLSAAPVSDLQFIIRKPDLGETEIIDPAAPVKYEKPRDYFKSGLCVAQNTGAGFLQGYEITVTGDIPVSKGCSSSSALVVAWVGLLLRLGGRAESEISGRGIAELAYRAEVLEFGEPGGMMDHFAAALGGVQYIHTAGAYETEQLPAPDGVFVLGDSLETKDTTGVLARVRATASAGLDFLREKDPAFKLATADPEHVEQALGADVSDPVRRAVLGNLRNRNFARRALKLMRRGDADPVQIGELISRQHAILRDDLGISTPRVEALIAAAEQAGATGAKINGSGGGGCMFALCADDPAPVVRAIDNAGGRARIITIDSGFREEKT